MKLKLVGLGLLAFFGVIAISVGIMFLTGTISMKTAGFRGEVKAQEIIKASGTFKIAAYDKFHNLCQEVLALEQQVRNRKELGIKDEKDEIQLLGLQNIHARVVSKYNADAAKDYTVGQYLLHQSMLYHGAFLEQ